jgi:hypothetical protein
MADHIVRLFTFGCSFTYGLVRKPEEYVGITGEKNRCKPWGDFIAEKLNIEHRNLGANGSGSKQIAWSVRNSNIKPGDVAIIAWSGPLRPFHWHPEKNKYLTLSAPTNIPYDQILYEHEMSIRATANYLKGLGVTYFMTSALMDYKQMEVMEKYTRDDWLNWRWIEWDMYNNSLFDICTNSWLSARCQKFDLSNTHNEQALIIEQYPGLTQDNNLLADCLHPSQDGHEKIAHTLMPYLEPYLENLLEDASNTPNL